MLDLIPIAALGIVCAVVAILTAVTGSFALGLVVGAVALALAVFSGWQVVARRRLAAELDEVRAKLISTQAEAASVAGPASVPRAAAAPPPVVEPDIDVTNSATEASSSELSGYQHLSAELIAGEPRPLTPESAILDENYLHVTLNGRVASARRHLRPLSLILLDAVTGVTFSDDVPPPEGVDHLSTRVAAPETVQHIVLETLRDADTVCRLESGRFALILEDTPENGAIWTVERIRRRINEELIDVTVWAGVACYPAHGFDGPEVFSQATRAILSARDWYQDRTEVAEG